MKFTVLFDPPNSEGIYLIADWIVPMGAYVAPDQPLVALTGDNATLTVVSPVHGVLFRRCALVGEALEAGEPLAVLAGVVEAPPRNLVALPSSPTAPLDPIIEHDVRALQSIPHRYTTIMVNTAEVTRLQHKAGFPTLAPFLAAALTQTLAQFPMLNGNSTVVHLSVDDRVVRDAQTKSVAALARSLAELAQSSRLEDQIGATFTITLGEAQTQTPIVRAPQVGHLYVGGRFKEPNIILSLATDVRYVRSQEAEQALIFYKSILENITAFYY